MSLVQDEPMKPWQHGFSLDFLKGLEKIYAQYNARAASPFTQIKKNNIAEAIHNKTFFQRNFGSYDVAWIKTVCKKKTDVQLYPGVVIGTKLPGDVVYTGIATNGEKIGRAHV